MASILVEKNLRSANAAASLSPEKLFSGGVEAPDAALDVGSVSKTGKVLLIAHL